MVFMKIRILFLSILVIFIFAFILWLIVNQGYLERLTVSLITKSLVENGVTFSMKSFNGNIRKGITIENADFKKGESEVKIEKIYIRARRTPILWGTFWVKEIKIEGVEAKIDIDGDKDREQIIKIPLWLTVFAKNVLIDIKRIEIESQNKKKTYENCIIKANFSYYLQHFVCGKLFVSIEKSPFKNSINFEGKAEAKLSKYAKAEGKINYGESEGEIRLVSDTEKEGRFVEFKLKNFLVHLKDFKEFADFPDLKILCNAEFYFSGNNLNVKGKFKEQTYGDFNVDSVGKIDGEVLKGKVSICSSPLYYSLSISEVRSDKIKINADLLGEYSYNYKDKVFFAKLKGKFKESQALGIDVSSGIAEVTVDNRTLNIFANFISKEAGKGNVEVDYNFYTDRVDIRFRTSETYPLKVLTTLGIDIPLPEPLKIASGKFNCQLAEILFEGETIVISIDAKDEKGGIYSVVLDFFNLELKTLSITGEKIPPQLWGMGAPFLYSGKMLFDFVSSDDFVYFELKDSYFDFEKFLVGPVNSTMKILNSGKIVFPKTFLDFSFGKAVVEGEFSEDGNYQGSAKVENFDLAKFDPSLGEGDLNGDFEFKGNLSSIKLFGDFSSEHLKLKESDFYEFKWKGNFELINGNYNFDFSIASDNFSLMNKNFNNLKAVFQKENHNGTFKFDLNLDDKNSVSAKGEIILDEKKNLSLFADSLIFEMGKRRLYLTKKASLEIAENLLTIKNLQLDSGNSKFSFSGSFGFGEGERKIEGELFMDNFSIVLLPFLNIPNALSGRIDAQLKIGGTLDNPNYFGELSLRNFAYELPESNLKLLGLLSCSFDKNKIDLRNAYLTTNEEGDLKITGFIDLSQKIPFFDLKFFAEDFPLQYKSFFSGLTDIDVSLKGNLDEPKIEGSVNILKGRIQLKETFVEELPPTIVFTGRTFPKLQKSFFKEIFSKLRGRLKIGSKRKLWILRKDLIAQLSGSVYVNFTEDGVQPEGKMAIEEGRFLLSGNKFDLKDSSFYFSSGKEIFPILDIQAQKEIAQYEIIIRLQGNAEKPTLTLSSTPPLEQEEILSLILFGRTSQNLNPEEGAKWGGAAAALAFSYEATPLLNSISKKINVDTILIGTSAKGDPQLGFSKYLSDRLILEYQQTFGTLPESNLNLRYRINKNFSIETNSSTQRHSGADFIWERKY